MVIVAKVAAMLRMDDLSARWLGASAGAFATSPAAAAGAETFYPGDLGQAIATIIVFVLLLLVLRKWAWGPVCRQLQRRENDIAEALDKAETRQKEAEEFSSFYQARMAGAEAEAENLLAKARKEAAEARERILQAARAEAREHAERSQRELERARQEAMRDLQRATAGLATDVAGRVIRRSLSEQEHRRLMEQSLAEIRKRVRED